VSSSTTLNIDDKFIRGTFYVFDKLLWRKVPKELVLDQTLFDGYVANDSSTPPSTSAR